VKIKSNILVVDDNADVREYIRDFLVDSGYNVLEARDGVEAIDLINENLPDLVTLDIMMPKMDGFEVCRRSKADKKTKHIPIIFLTARSDRESKLEGLSYGAEDYLTKPFDCAELTVRINRLLPGPKSVIEEEYIAFAQFGDRIKVVSLAPDGTYSFIDEENNVHSIFYIVTSAILELQTAIDELESLINDPSAKEKDFQIFFERYPNFILSDHYRAAHPHIVLTNTIGKSLIPDFVLEPFDKGSLCDLLELKLPQSKFIILKSNRLRFSAAVMEACAQLREYSIFFDEEKNRKAVFEKYGLKAWRPKMLLIIGRKGRIDPFSRRKIEIDHPNLNLTTYDDIIEKMRLRLERMKQGRI